MKYNFQCINFWHIIEGETSLSKLLIMKVLGSNLNELCNAPLDKLSHSNFPDENGVYQHLWRVTI